ncbi:MAG TPA: IclR family transcriptional regulator [Candidatus Binatia bacterium]|nr:IclR family transcriptional regulator [Candidatus Binatia bacterium]
MSSASKNGKTGKTTKRLYRIQVIDRAVQLLDCFGFERSELSVSEIASRTRLHKSTVHRILMALEYNDVIRQNQVSGDYYLGMKLFKLGNQAAARIDLRNIAKPYLIRLMEQTQETVHLAILDDDQVLYLEKVEGAHALRMPSRVGRRIPTFCTSLGKAMLSCLTEPDIRRILKTQRLQTHTGNTIRDIDRLESELKETRKRGYAVDNEEIELGLRCVGAAIRDHSGNMVGAISVAGPSARLKPENIPMLGKTVMKVASAISEELGYEDVEAYKKVLTKQGSSRPS